jgi:hypothetical protein
MRGVLRWPSPSAYGCPADPPLCANCAKQLRTLDHLPPATHDALKLVATELASNSLRHSGLGDDDHFDVVIDTRGGRPRVDVRDGGNGLRFALQGAPGRSERSGRAGRGCRRRAGCTIAPARAFDPSSAGGTGGSARPPPPVQRSKRLRSLPQRGWRSCMPHRATGSPVDARDCLVGRTKEGRGRGLSPPRRPVS